MKKCSILEAKMWLSSGRKLRRITEDEYQEAKKLMPLLTIGKASLDERSRWNELVKKCAGSWLSEKD